MKFSQVPYFLIKKYLDNIVDITGGNIIELYTSNNNHNNKIEFIVEEIIDNKIEKEFILSKKNNVTINNGDLIYFKKGGNFYNWLLNTAESLYINGWYDDFDIHNFVNLFQNFMYFGDIYEKSKNKYTLKHVNLFNYINKLLPDHQRTHKISVLNELSFGNIFDEIYNSTKNLNNLIEPLEAKPDFLDSILDYTNWENPSLFSDEKNKRDYIKNIVKLLKKKGTYSAIYTLWKILSENSSNNINIYERWHSNNITGDVSESDYIDYLYLYNILSNYNDPYFYNFLPWTNVTGEKFIIKDFTNASSITIEHTFDNISYEVYDTSYNIIQPENVTLNPSANIVFEFDPPNSGYIIIFDNNENSSISYNESSISSTSYTNTVSGFSYSFPTSANLPITFYYDTNKKYFEPGTVILSESEVKTNLGSGTMLIEESDLKVNSGEISNNWSLQHNLNANGLIIDTYDSNWERVYPELIKPLDKNRTYISWSEPISGFALFKSVGNLPDVISNTLMLSPHYIIEIELTNEPIDTNSIISKDIHNELISYWENIRPVNRVSNYQLLIAPTSTMSTSGSNNAYDLYENLNTNLYVKSWLYDTDKSYFSPSLSTYNNIIKYNNSILISPYFEIGSDENNENSWEYQALINEVNSDSEYIYLLCKIPKDNTYIIRRIGIRANDNTLLFNTQCSDIYKNDGIYLNIYYKIKKE